MPDQIASSPLNTDELMRLYVHICNEALYQNKDRFPFKQILGAAQKAENQHSIEVVVSDQQDKAHYIFQIDGEQLTVKPHDDCEECDCIRQWDVDVSYLNDVVKAPNAYISNPAKINWEWMYDA